MSTHHDASDRISNEDGADAKQVTEYLDEIDGVQNADKPKRGLEAPELVRNLTAEERIKLEKKLVRKIDLRLLPPVIIMYIMNYLDRVSCLIGIRRGLD